MIVRAGAYFACILLVLITQAWGQQLSVEERAALEEQLRLDYIENLKALYQKANEDFGEATELYSSEHRKITFIYMSVFEDMWLITMESHPQLALQRTENLTENLRANTEIRVARMSYASLNEGRLIEHWSDAVRHHRITEDYYARRFQKAEFQEAFDLVSAATRNVSIIENAELGCEDGAYIFAKVQDSNNEKLIARHNCDEDYQHILQSIHTFFEVAWTKFPELAPELHELWNAQSQPTGYMK